MEFVVRGYEPGDAAALANVMWRSVRLAALADYSVTQTDAWLPAARSPEAMHRWASDGRRVVVATSCDDVVGYIDLELDGHIDHLYCAPEVIGTGVAAALYARLEREAIAAGLAQLRVEASEGGRRFFEKQQFLLECRQDLTLGGVAIHNYRMSKLVADV